MKYYLAISNSPFSIHTVLNIPSGTKRILRKDENKWYELIKSDGGSTWHDVGRPNDHKMLEITEEQSEFYQSILPFIPYHTDLAGPIPTIHAEIKYSGMKAPSANDKLDTLLELHHAGVISDEDVRREIDG